jgi:hypothetical protein
MIPMKRFDFRSDPNMGILFIVFILPGLEWTCPLMRTFKAACTSSGCGCNNCRMPNGRVVGCESCNCPARRRKSTATSAGARRLLDGELHLGYTETQDLAVADVAAAAAVPAADVADELTADAVAAIPEASSTKEAAEVSSGVGVDDVGVLGGEAGDGGEGVVQRIIIEDPEEVALREFEASEAAKAAAGGDEEEVQAAASTAYRTNAADPFLSRYYRNTRVGIEERMREE